MVAFVSQGTGKSYTLGTSLEARPSNANAGIVPRVIEAIYDKINSLSKQSPRSRFNVSLQYIAVDDADIHDLLKPTTQTNPTNNGASFILENITTVDIVGGVKELSGRIRKGIQASRLLVPSNSKRNQPYHLLITFLTSIICYIIAIITIQLDQVLPISSHLVSYSNTGLEQDENVMPNNSLSLPSHHSSSSIQESLSDSLSLINGNANVIRSKFTFIELADITTATSDNVGADDASDCAQKGSTKGGFDASIESVKSLITRLSHDRRRAADKGTTEQATHMTRLLQVSINYY